MNIPLKELIETHAGGVIGGWDNLQAVIPGGSSMPLIPKEKCETLTMDFDSLMAEKSGLGTAGIVVINKDQDIIKCMARIARFYKHESCGQCTPCREGSGWMWRMLERMAEGEATKDEIEMLGDVTNQYHQKSPFFSQLYLIFSTSIQLPLDKEYIVHNFHVYKILRS